ncbi:hypothetical protein BDF14DRAFT_1881027 [Spinellus fusiger]|nr:hypothetical protein BDF14DRAFT_1881027 [Spinellus fusiger]
MTLFTEIAVLLSPRAMSSLGITSSDSSDRVSPTTYANCETKINTRQPSSIGNHIQLPQRVFSVNTHSLQRLSDIESYLLEKKGKDSDIENHLEQLSKYESSIISTNNRNTRSSISRNSNTQQLFGKLSTYSENPDSTSELLSRENVAEWAKRGSYNTDSNHYHRNEQSSTNSLSLHTMSRK